MVVVVEWKNEENENEEEKQLFVCVWCETHQNFLSLSLSSLNSQPQQQ